MIAERDTRGDVDGVFSGGEALLPHLRANRFGTGRLMRPIDRKQKSNCEDSALARRIVINTHGRVVRVGNLLDNRQTQAGAAA